MHATDKYPQHFPLRKLDRTALVEELLLPRERRTRSDHAWPFLYRFYDANRLPLYIGITSIDAVRWDQHRKRSAWWPLAEFVAVSVYATYDDVLDAERFALRAETPRFNKQGVRWPTYAALRLAQPPEEAADLLLRQARPEYLARLVQLLQDPSRAPAQAPPSHRRE
jgi:hypothetical protein